MTLIDKICEEFERYPKIRVFVAERRERLGSDLVDKIIELIENSHLVLVVWSHNLEKSIMAHNEIGYAKAIDKQIYPFMVSGMVLSGFLEGAEYMEFDPYSPEKDIRRLVNAVRKQALSLGYEA